ncbi:MAG: LptA/OstA family protein, partial [Acidobacteriota bacterium]
TGLDDSDGDPPAATAATDAETLTEGEGFAYVQTIDGRQVFYIQAEKSLQDRQDTTYLETVILDIYREDGETYRVTSDNARVNESTWEARLEGNVVVSGWGDLELEARAFDLRQGGQLLASHGAVEFRYPPELEGRATKLLIDRRNDTIRLTEGVHIRSSAGSETPIRLDCERLIFKRGEGLIRALDNAYVRFGDQELWARAFTIFLLDDKKSLRSLRANFDVAGVARTATDFGGENRIEFRGETLELTPNPAQPNARKVKLNGGSGQPAFLKLVDADGVGRTLTASYLESQTLDGQPMLIQGAGEPLLINEFLDFEEPFPLRQVCAHRIDARFQPEGGLDQIFLRRNVEVTNRDISLSGGSQALLEIETGKVSIEGPMVELFSERGDLAAPKITYSREQGLISAKSGVRASFEPGAAAAFEQTPFGQGRGPIRIESGEAFYTTEPAAFTFIGQVRAWRDQNLLLAEQLRGDQDTQELSASGGIRTLWFTAPQRNGEASAAGAQPQPIEVIAELLTYNQTDRVVSYSGDVRIEQDRRTLTCGELDVELDSNGREAQRMTCRRDVRLVDRQVEPPGAERRVSGDLAVYTVTESRIEIYGEQVELVDTQKNRLRGGYLIYDLDANTVGIKSEPPALAQTAR